MTGDQPSGLSKILVASGNQGKINEFKALFEKSDIEMASQNDYDVSEVAETGTTYVENAIIKARHCCQQTNLPSIADDSGLEVDVLQGLPGVRSARYAGDQADDELNIQKLLTELNGVEDHARTARFRCVLVFMRTSYDPAPIIAEGVFPCKIVKQKQGQDGFGYDPVFQPMGYDVTNAELSSAEKNQISHRGIAMKNLFQKLTENYPGIL